MLRGWIGPSRHLSANRQRALLEADKVSVIYTGADEWQPFVLSLRPEVKDTAVVADLRVFGSRRGIVDAVEEIAARGATLMVAGTGVTIDVPTLREVDRAISRLRAWVTLERGRASKMGAMGGKARAANLRETRMERSAAERIYGDLKRYPTTLEALENMPGWSRTSAWREFKGREETAERLAAKRRARLRT
jgi:hypothetical protein